MLIDSEARGTYKCTACGPVDSLTAGIAHVVANQFDVA